MAAVDYSPKGQKTAKQSTVKVGRQYTTIIYHAEIIKKITERRTKKDKSAHN